MFNASIKIRLTLDELTQLKALAADKYQQSLTYNPGRSQFWAMLVAKLHDHLEAFDDIANMEAQLR